MCSFTTRQNVGIWCEGDRSPEEKYGAIVIKTHYLALPSCFNYWAHLEYFLNWDLHIDT